MGVETNRCNSTPQPRAEAVVHPGCISRQGEVDLYSIHGQGLDIASQNQRELPAPSPMPDHGRPAGIRLGN
jgi:hypothetical protein